MPSQEPPILPYGRRSRTSLKQVLFELLALPRATFLLLCVALFLLTASLYAGEAWLAFYALLLTDGLLAAGWTIAAGLLGYVLLRRLKLADQGALGIATSCAMGLGIYSLVALLLGLAGWLNRATAIALPVLSIALFLGDLFIRHGNVPLEGVSARLEQWLSSRVQGWWLWMAIVPFLAIASVGATLPPAILWKNAGDPHPYDVLEYHLELPREWYQQGRITQPMHNALGYFPFNAEMEFLLAMHVRGGPWRGIYMAQFLSLAYALLMVIAVCGVSARLFENGESSCARSAVGAAVVPWTAMLGCVAYNESALLLYAVLAVGWAAMGRFKNPAGLLGPFLLAGAMAGFACGVKYTAVPLLLLAVPAILILLPMASMKAGRVLAGCALFVAIGVLVFSPWLVRNWKWTGNPVFPEAMHVFGRGHFSANQEERWERAHSAPEQSRSLSARSVAFWKENLQDRRYGWIFWPVVVGAGALAWRSRINWFLLAMILASAIFWTFFTHLQSRFFALTIPVAALVIGQRFGRTLDRVFDCAVIAIAIVGFLILHQSFTKESQLFLKAGALGLDDFALLASDELQKRLQQEDKLALVGDAKAFMYPIPISKLKYRTVFDVDEKEGEGWIEAWLGPDAAQIQKDHYMVIDAPAELFRLWRSYHLKLPMPDPVDNKVQILPPLGIQKSQ